MIAHQSDAAEVLRLALTGTHVSISGPAGADVGGTLSHLEVELAARGYETVRLEAGVSLSAAPLAALRLALPDVVADARDPSTAIDRFCRYLSGFTSPALIVSDIDAIDPFTERALLEATRRSRAVIVGSQTVPRFASSMTGLPQLTPMFLRRLSHLELDRWLSSLTEHPLEQELVTRLYIDSSGGPLFARSLLLNGIRHGDIALSSGLWTLAAAELWSPETRGLVETWLGGLAPEALDVLRTIHLLGSPPVAEALNRFSPRVVSDLERAGVVGVLRSRTDEPLVVVTPPVVARYLDRETGEVFRAALGVEPLEAGFDEEGVLAAELARAGQESSERAKARFDESPTAGAAAAAVAALWMAGGTLEEAEQLIARVTAPSDHGDELHLAVLHARWLAFGEDRFDEGIAVLDALRWSGTVELLRRGHRAVLTVLAHGLTPRLARELRNLALLPATSFSARWLRTSIASLALLGGRARSAQRLLATISPDAELRALWTFTSAHAALATDERASGMSLASVELDRARAERDPDGIFAAAHALMGIEIFNGGWAEAQIWLRVARAVLRPSLYSMSFYRTAMSLQAVVLAEDGDEDVAQGALRAVGRAGVLAPISWGQSESPNFVPALAAREYEDLARSLASAGESVSEAGGTLSASELWAWAIALDPRLVTRCLVLSHPRELPAYVRFVDFIRALMSPAVDLDTLVREHHGGSFAYLAILALVRYSQIYRTEEPSRSALAAALVDGYCARMSIAPPAKVIEGRLPILGLTPREIEVALMASRLSNRAIAERLNISERTVDHHVSNALQKSGARNRHELSALVARIRREW